MYLNLTVRRSAHIASVTCRCTDVPAPQSPFTANTNGVAAVPDLEVEGPGEKEGGATALFAVHAARATRATPTRRLTARAPSALSRDAVDQGRQPNRQILRRPRGNEVPVDHDRLVDVFRARV